MVKKGGGKKTEITTPKASKRVVKVTGTITLGDLAKRMGVKANEIIAKAMGLGLMVTINQPVDADSAAILASDFGYEVENVEIVEEKLFVETEKEEVTQAEDLAPRPPVVTVMGHVDHGKTSLLDAIRKTNVTDAESGGITQHIGAYTVDSSKGKITFVDTPGHEAFTEMRARGAQVTDIVILVVAADDGVMPQTREAANHAKAAGVPIIVAVNKIDKPEAEPEKVKQQLTELELVPEEWGGDTIFAEVSAITKKGIDELLDLVQLQSEVLELKASPTVMPKGIIVESRLDRGRGAVATMLVKEGTFEIGMSTVCGTFSGKIRAMLDDRGNKISEATPSMPVEILGIGGVAEVGDLLRGIKDDKTAKQISDMRLQKQRQEELGKTGKVTLEDLYSQIQQGEVKELNIVLKGDVFGSVEALKDSITKLATEKAMAKVIHSGVGGITENDINLASASKAIVIGFNVRPESNVQAIAEKQGVDIRLYKVIYEALDEIKASMSGLLEPKKVENTLGRARVKEVFKIGKVGTIAGSEVIEGKIARSGMIRVLRDGAIIHEGKSSSLKHFKEDVREVKSGSECGIGVENFNDIKAGDELECYEEKTVKQEL